MARVVKSGQKGSQNRVKSVKADVIIDILGSCTRRCDTVLTDTRDGRVPYTRTGMSQSVNTRPGMSQSVNTRLGTSLLVEQW